MFYTIYQIQDRQTGYIYVGKHRTMDLLDGYMGSGTRIRNAVRKYGASRFEKTILFIFDNEAEMDLKEAEIVNADFILREDTLNIEMGGSGGFSSLTAALNGAKGFRTTIARRDKDPSWWQEYRAKCSGFTGKTHDDEARAKISKASALVNRAGKNNSQFGTMWITDGVSNTKIEKLAVVPEGWHKGRVTK